MRFQGTKNYIATEDLKLAVDAALNLEKPLLVKGEPGTGKTMLALEVAESLGLRLIEWHIKSTTKASQGLYEYDAVSRLRDSQLGNEKVKDIKNYINKGKLWDAFDSDEQVVLLVDEVDNQEWNPWKLDEAKMTADSYYKRANQEIPEKESSKSF